MATVTALPRRISTAAKLPRSLRKELAGYVLDRCREVVTEYTELSRRQPSEFPFSERDLATWYAEMRYKLLGAGHCSLCGAHVRHVLPVMAELGPNTAVLHDCLCPHCLAAQESAARRVVVCLDQLAAEPVEARCAA